MPAHNASERAEQRRLREQMRGSGMSYAEIAAEMARRYQFRPRKAWRAAWGWTLEEAAGRYNALRAKGAHEAVTSLTGSRLSEWENWPLNTRKPSFLSLCLLAEIYHCPVLDLIDFRDREHLPPGELLALDKTGTGPLSAENRHDPQREHASTPGTPLTMTVLDRMPAEDGMLRARTSRELASGLAGSHAAVNAGASVVLGEMQLRGVSSAWPAWFGLKLAQLITITDAWLPASGLGLLQMLLNEEILMSEAAVAGSEPQLKTHVDVSRRQALMTIGALPVAMTGSGREGGLDSDVFLARCAASLTACWHLLKGSDLPAVEQLLAGYLVPLEAVASRPSPQRQAAAVLAAQAHRICGIISLHREQLAVREHHCRRALHFAEIASDASSHASALISLASTYFYAADPEAAAATYEQAFRHDSVLPHLQRSRVHAELAVVYGQLGREQDSVRAAAEAEELYPEHPEQDPSYLYAEFTPGSLALERGLACIALAEKFPGRGYGETAASVFAQAAVPGPAVPDRIRFEIVNHQARTAVLLGDLDAFEGFMAQGLEGAALLGSRQRLRETRATWLRAQQQWAGEQRLRALRDGLRQNAAAEALG